jgi:TRAP-type C4-dicarboxylate transport system permease small subunit
MGQSGRAHAAGGALGALGRACDHIEWVTVRIAALALAVMVLLTTCDALARYFFTSPIDGATEISNEFLMPILVYFSISFVYRLGGHVRVTLLSDLLPPGVQGALLRIADGATVLLFAAITWGVAVRTQNSWQMNEYSSSPLGYHLAPSYAIVAVGGALMTIRAFIAFVTGRHPSPLQAQDVESY